MFKKRPARAVVASVGLATAAALVGVGAAVAQSGDTTGETAPGKSAEDHGLHKGWAKVIDNDSNGNHKGWDQHGQHGGAPADEGTEDHGKAGDDHGRAGEEGKGAEKGQAGQDHGKAGN